MKTMAAAIQISQCSCVIQARIAMPSSRRPQPAPGAAQAGRWRVISNRGCSDIGARKDAQARHVSPWLARYFATLPQVLDLFGDPGCSAIPGQAHDLGCPASTKASFDLQRQFPKLSSSQRLTTAARAPKAPGPDAASKRAIRGCPASSRARKHHPVHFMRSALARAVKEGRRVDFARPASLPTTSCQ